MANPDGRVLIDTELDQSGLRTGLSGLGTSVVHGMQVALAAVTAAVSAGAAAVVQYGVEFESAFAGVKKTVDATDEELATLRQGILDMSEELPFAAADIAGVAEAAGQLGIQTDSILDFTETMVQLGTSTDLSAEQAAITLAKFANVVGMSQDDFDELGSSIVAVGNSTAAFESEIAAMAMRLAGTGSMVGMSEAEIIGLSGALTSVGLAAEAGGSAFSRVLNMMQLASEQGGESLEALGSVAGMTGEEFAAAFNENATDALLSFVEGLGSAEERGESAIGIISRLGEEAGLSAIDTIVVSDALKRAAQNCDGFRETIETSTAAWEENVALTNEAAQRYETLESKTTMLANAAKNLGTALYDGIQEPLKESVDFAKEMVQSLEDAYKEGGFSGLASSVGNVLTEAVSFIASYVPQIVDAGTKVINGFLDGIRESSGEIIPIIVSIYQTIVESYGSIASTLIETVAGVLVEISSAVSEALPNLLNTILGAITGIVTSIIGALPQIAGAITEIAASLVETIAEFLPTLIETVTSLVTALVEALPEILSQLLEAIPALIESISVILMESVPLLIDAAFQIVTAIVDALPEIIETILTVLPEIISAIVSALLNLLPMLVDCGVQLLVSLVQALPEIIGGIVAVLPEIISAIVSSLVGMIGDIIACGIKLLTSLVAALPQIIIAIVAVLPQIVMAIVEALLDNIDEIIQCGVDLLTALIEALPEILVALCMAAPKIIAAIIQALVSNIGKFVEAGIKLFVALIQALPQIIVSLIQAVPQIIQSLIQAFQNTKQQFVDAGRNIISGLGQGISNAIGGLVSTAVSAARSLVSSVKGFFGIASPSKLFRDVIGENLMLGWAEGIEDNTSAAVNAMKDATKDVTDAAKFDDIVSGVQGTVTGVKIANGQTKTDGETPTVPGGGNTVIGDINVYIYGDVEDEEEARELGEDVGEEIQRKLRYKGVLTYA